MVSAKFDNTPKLGQRERTGSFVKIVILLAWVAVAVAVGSLWWNDRSTMTGSQWSGRAANGAAICLAVIYGSAIILGLWLLAQWFIYSRWIWGFTVFCIGIVPAVLTLWMFLEGKLSPESKFHFASGSLVTKLVDLDVLAHMRLLGGSLWQPTQVGTAVKIMSPSPQDSENRVLSELDNFVQQIRSVIGSQSKHLVFIHFDPPSGVAVADTTNWIAFDKPIRNADAITQNVWLNCAEATLRGDITGNSNPPSVFTAGYAEYFSRSTDDIMDDYFDAAHKSEFMSKLSDLTSDLNYAQDSHEHHLVGGAFLTYLIEELHSRDFLALCEVKGREQFESYAQSKLGKPWSEVCDGFEEWLDVEADRLGWKHDKASNSSAEVQAERDMSNSLTKIAVSDNAFQEPWNELLGEVTPIYQARVNADVNFGIEIKTKFDDNMKDTSIEFDQRLRALKEKDHRWYSAVDKKGEMSLALSTDDSVRAERLASKLLRQTHVIPSQVERERASDKVDQALKAWMLQGDLIACLDHYLNRSESWTLKSLSRQDEESSITIELASNQEPPASLQLSVDPSIGYRVKEIRYINGKESEKIQQDFVRYGDDYVIASEDKAVVEKKTSLARIQSLAKFHLMSQNEAGSFREELAYMKKTNMQPQSETVSVPLQLLRMMFLAFLSATGIGAVVLMMRS